MTIAIQKCAYLVFPSSFFVNKPQQANHCALSKMLIFPFSFFCKKENKLTSLNIASRLSYIGGPLDMSLWIELIHFPCINLLFNKLKAYELTSNAS